MAARKKTTRTHSQRTGLVPALRDAVKLVDRALAALGREPDRPGTQQRPRRARKS